MGSPSKSIDRAKETLQNGIADISLGAQQLKEGNVEKGLTNLGVGQFNTLGGGYILAAGGAPIKGETALTKQAQAEANQATADAANYTATQEASRQQKIKDRLSAEIGLRQKAPGKAQTLLTSTLTPNGVNNNSLLTSTLTGMGKR